MLCYLLTQSSHTILTMIKLKILRLKVKVPRLGKDGVDVKMSKNVKKPSWMTPVTHGYHIVEDPPRPGGGRELEQPDSVVVQREESGNLELWFFGVSDARIGDGIAKYLQSNLFTKNLKESQVRRKGKEIMRKGHLNARAKLEADNVKNVVHVGCVSAMVIDGRRLVMAQMGGYRVIVCKDGMAHQLRETNQRRGKRHWSSWFISGVMHIPKVHIKACHSASEPTKSPEVIVSTERIDSEIEFVILASSGIIEVMRNQEAVDLISHIDDPQEAAECLAREAVARMSKSIISCLVIRFD